MSKVHAVVYAGGRGEVGSGAAPIQFHEVEGRSIFIRAIECFETHPEIDSVVAVCVEDWIPELRSQIERSAFTKVIAVVPGGRGHVQSVRNGLRAVTEQADADDMVLLHEGVRPLVDAALISSNIRAAREHGAAITAEPLRSTIWGARDARATPVTADGPIHATQAPHTFRIGQALDLYQWADEMEVRVLDPMHLCSMCGVKPYVVQGPAHNVRVLRPEDIDIVAALVAHADKVAAR